MKFKVVMVNETSKGVIVSGRFSPDPNDESEKIGLPIMVEELQAIPAFTDKLATNSRRDTVLFKSVEVGLLKDQLKHLSSVLEFNLEYVPAKNYCGDPELYEKYFSA